MGRAPYGNRGNGNVKAWKYPVARKTLLFENSKKFWYNIQDFFWHHREGNVFINLDHDLGEEKTGYDIYKFIIIPLFGTILYTINSGQ